MRDAICRVRLGLARQSVSAFCHNNDVSLESATVGSKISYQTVRVAQEAV